MLSDKDLKDPTKQQLKKLVAQHRKHYDDALARGDTDEAMAHMKAVGALSRKVIKLKEERQKDWTCKGCGGNIFDRVRSRKFGDALPSKTPLVKMCRNCAEEHPYTTRVSKASIKRKLRNKSLEDFMKKMKMEEAVVKPMMYNDHPDIDKLNRLLEDALARPFQSSFVAVQTIRAALDLFGITLPRVEIEQDIEKPSSIAALRMLHAGKRIPPADTDCEYAFKLTSVHGEEGLYLYMVIDLDREKAHYDAYATVVDDEDLTKLINIDIPDVKHEYPDDGKDSGTPNWDERIRHTNDDDDSDGDFTGEAG